MPRNQELSIETWSNQEELDEKAEMLYNLRILNKKNQTPINNA